MTAKRLPFGVARPLSKKELNVPKWYWLCVAAFFVVGCVATVVAVKTDDPYENPATLGVCAAMFFMISAGFAGYPILRWREKQGIQTERIRTRECICDAVLFPASRVMQFGVLFGSLFLALALTAMVIFGIGDINRAKAWIGIIGLSGVFLLALSSSLKGRLGIVVAPHGIIWRELLGAHCLIPWSDVARIELFMKRERYNSKGILAIGLDMVDIPSGRISLLARNKIKSAKASHNWQFSYSTESMAVPLFWVAAVLNYYRQHPEARNEIGTPAGLNRIQELGVQTQSIESAITA